MVTAPAQARTAASGAAESGATVAPADTNQSALQPATDTLAATDHRHRCPANELRRHYWDKPFLGRSAASKYWPLPQAACCGHDATYPATTHDGVKSPRWLHWHVADPDCPAVSFPPARFTRAGFSTGGPLELVRAVTGAHRVPLRKVRCTPSLRRVRRFENPPSARIRSRKSLDIYPGGRTLAAGVFEAAKFVERSGGVDVERCAERSHGGRVRIQWYDLGCRVQRSFVPRKFIVRVVLQNQLCNARPRCGAKLDRP